MSKKIKQIQAAAESAEELALQRRRFLGGMALSAGAMAMLGGMGREQQAQAAEGGTGAPAAVASAVSQPPPLAEVKGRTAYVTGGNTGIGLGIARALANAGMNVVMGYIQEDQVAPALKLFKPGQNVTAMRHDVTDRDGWVKLLADINAKYGNLHLLVNNAGIKTLKQASQVDAKGWDAAVAVNFTGIYNGCAACLPHFRAHNEGAHIVTTASMGGILPGVTAGVYTATKFAAFGIMEALRMELLGTNIGTSVFSPGGVSTDNIVSADPSAGTAPLMMDPLEAGERVLNGIRNNDLFIFSHPEFKPGMKERFDAILASVPREAFPEARAKAETRVLTAPPYAPEIVHRNLPRKSYRG
jgi:NAD(P)-dependent dehydrogenase (short-subunit alcohol dehydrogenase family)